MQEFERARFIFSKAVERELDQPEHVWKAFIDFEIDQGKYENARRLYEQLAERTKHVKVWISLAKFESETVQSLENARSVYNRAIDWFKENEPEQKEERSLLLEGLLKLEEKYGTSESISECKKRQPR